MLVQADTRLPHGIPPVVGGASEAGALEVGNGQSNLQRDDTLDRIVACDKHGL